MTGDMVIGGGYFHEPHPSSPEILTSVKNIAMMTGLSCAQGAYRYSTLCVQKSLMLEAKRGHRSTYLLRLTGHLT
jgi:hypothetical protein